MAHVYTRTAWAKPTLALSLVAGGSLEPNTTYYYRVVSQYNSKYPSSCLYRSPASDVQSITTDAVNKTIRLTVTHGTGNPEYTAAWVSQGVDPGTGNWNDQDNYPDVRYLSNGSTNQNSITGEKLTVVDDDGVTYGWFSTIYRLGPSTNYGFSPLNEDGKDRLTCSGGTTEDPITFDSIYNEAVAQGWPLGSTIEKIEMTSGDYALKYHVGYTLNFRQLVVDEGGSGVFDDQDKTIVVDNCVLDFRCNTYLGTYIETRDLTVEGINFIIAGHGTSFGQIKFQCGSNELRIYDTAFNVRRALFSVSNTYGARVMNTSLDWRLIDVKILGTTFGGGLNNGFEIGAAAADESCLLRRVRTGYHRYAGQFTAAYPFTVDGCVINPYGGTGLIVYHYDDAERVYTGLTIAGIDGVECLYIRRLSPTSGYRTFMACVDSEIVDFEKVRWYGKAELPTVPGSYCDLRNTINIRVVDQNGDGIEGATVVCENTDGDQEFSAQTVAGGSITEQTITVKRQTPEPDNATVSYTGGIVTDYSPFTFTIEKAGFQDLIVMADIEAATDWDISLTPNTSLAWAELYGVASIPIIAVTETNVESDVTVEGPGHSITVEEA